MKQIQIKKWFLSALLGSALVACGLFGTPEETQENAYSVPVGAAITNPNISSVTPAHNDSAILSTAITITFSSPQTPSTIETNFALLGTGFSVAPASNLNLTAMCNGRWRVRNPNNVAVVFTWDIYNSAGNNREEGNGIVPANADVFFTTKNGQKTARVFVGTKQHSVKAANLTPCNGAMPSMPNKIAGAFTWNSSNTILTFQPTAALTAGATHTVFIGLTKPFASSFIAGSPLTMTSAAPVNLLNDKENELTITGTGFTNTTAFFIQSTKLEVMSFTATSAKVKLPSGFIPSKYGLMAADNTGTRATLYPAFTITQGAAPKEIDPELNYNSFVEGYVRDNQTKTPISGATVGIPGLETTTTTDGYYLLQGVPSGRQALEIKKDGYEPLYRIAEVPVSSNGQTLTMKLAELEPKSERITMIGSSGGTHYASENGEAGPFIRIPAGALDSEVPIQFTHLRTANTLPELPQDGYYLAFAKLRPTGLVFKKPATLFLPLQEGIVIPVNQSINISYFDAREARWVDDITKGKISSINNKLFLEYEINHFTWIGGTWFDDRLTACVVDQNGDPVNRITTSVGVSDIMGKVYGTLTRSDIGRTITAYAILPDGTQSNSVSETYSGNGEVNLTPCIVYETKTPRVEGPLFEENDSLDIIEPFGTKLNQAIRPQSSDGLRDIDGTRVLISRNVKSVIFYYYDHRAGLLDTDTVEVFLRGVKQTRATVKALSSSTLEVKLFPGDNPGEPFKTGLFAEFKVTGKTKQLPNRPPQEIKIAEKVHIVAKFEAGQTLFTPSYELDEDYPFWESPTEPVTVKGKNQLVVIYPAGESITNFMTRTPVTVLDDTGKVMKISFSSVAFKFNSASFGITGATPAPMTDGIAFIPVTYNAEDPEKIQAILEKKGLEINGGVSPLSTQSAVQPQFAVVLVPIAAGVAAFVAAAPAVLDMVQNQQGALSLPAPDFTWFTDWAAAGIKEVSLTAQAAATTVGALITASIKPERKKKVKVETKPVAITPDPCKPNGDDEAPPVYSGDPYDKWLIQTERWKAVATAWLDEAELIFRTGRTTREWSAAQLVLLRSLGGNSTKLASIRQGLAEIVDITFKEAGEKLGADLIKMFKNWGILKSALKGKVTIEGQEVAVNLVQEFAGHHINSVSRNPNFAGDPNNIAFVERDKHIKDCHDGKSSNWSLGNLLKRRGD